MSEAVEKERTKGNLPIENVLMSIVGSHSSTGVKGNQRIHVLSWVTSAGQCEAKKQRSSVGRRTDGTFLQIETNFLNPEDP